MGSWIIYLKYLDNSGRKMLARVWLEKLPFFLLSLIFGLLAVSTQRSSGNLQGWDFSLFQQLSLAAYGFVSYLAKLFFPFHLSAFYPYPFGINDSFPVFWYVFPLLMMIVAVFVIYSLRKTKLIFFTTAFFVVTIAMVLQWLPVGKAIMADRYSYLSSMALFYLAAEGIYLLWQKNLKWITIPLLTLFTLYFSFFTFHRSGVWSNEITLWNDVLSKYENVPLAYLNRGIAYAKANEMDKAIDDISKAIQLDSDYTKANKNLAKAYYNRGKMYMNRNDFDKALNDFNKSVEMSPGNAGAWFNRGNVCSEMEEYQKALADYTKAIELDPKEAKPYINRGLVYASQKEFEKALKDFDSADQITPTTRRPISIVD